MKTASPRGAREHRQARADDASAERQDSDRLTCDQTSTASRTAPFKNSLSAAGKADLIGIEKEKRKLQEKVCLIKNRIRCMHEENEKNKRLVEDFKDKKSQVIKQKIEKIVVKEAVEEAKKKNEDLK